MQKLVLYLIVMIAIFSMGILLGKKIERKQAATMAQTSSMEETIDGEQLFSEEASITEEPPVQTEAADVSVSENTSVSGNTGVSGNASVSDNASVSENKPHWNTEYQDPAEKMTLKQREGIRSSYEETLAINQQDKTIIANNTIDFSNMTIACLGDSLTEQNDSAVSYPTQLKEILGAKEVYNYGHGGSTIASGNGVATMIDRIYDIPKDVDAILVLGGTNDNFQQPSWEFGFMDWETKGEGTFCGDLQLLMRKFKWTYEKAAVLFMTPPSNSKIDELRAKDPNLLEQAKYAEAINYIGAEEHIQVNDLYNANFLNSHDPEILSHFMIDNVHGNTEGNRILAEHAAAELIKRYQ